jgi:hypothetical protein
LFAPAGTLRSNNIVCPLSLDPEISAAGVAHRRGGGTSTATRSTGRHGPAAGETGQTAAPGGSDDRLLVHPAPQATLRGVLPLELASEALHGLSADEATSQQVYRRQVLRLISTPHQTTPGLLSACDRELERVGRLTKNGACSLIAHYCGAASVGTLSGFPRQENGEPPVSTLERIWDYF